MHGPVAKPAIFAIDMPTYAVSPERRKDIKKLSLAGLTRSSEPETFKLPPLLWDEIKAHIKAAEMPFFKRVIGTDLIENNMVP